MKDTKTGKSRGYGFVEFSDDREADRKHTLCYNLAALESSLILLCFTHARRCAIDGRSQN